jgi:ELWxxDGT repeat protein
MLYFAGQADNAYTLWRSDGTPNGTYSVGGTEAYMWEVTAVGNTIFWVSDAANHGNELWRYVP